MGLCRELSGKFRLLRPQWLPSEEFLPDRRNTLRCLELAETKILFTELPLLLSKIINENSLRLTKALPCLLPSMHPFFGAALLGPKVVASSRRSAHKECMEGMGTSVPLALARSTVQQPSTGHPPIQSAPFIQTGDLNNSFLGSTQSTVTGKQGQPGQRAECLKGRIISKWLSLLLTSVFKVRSEARDYGLLVTALSKETQDHLFLKLLVCKVNDKLGLIPWSIWGHQLWQAAMILGQWRVENQKLNLKHKQVWECINIHKFHTRARTHILFGIKVTWN